MKMNDHTSGRQEGKVLYFNSAFVSSAKPPRGDFVFL
jgi:hypothetical protein